MNLPTEPSKNSLVKRKRRLFNHRKKEFLDELLKRHGPTCQKCGIDVILIDQLAALIGIQFTIATIDHIIPIARGGAWKDIHNMQILCEFCHAEKTAGEAQVKYSPRNWRY